MPPAVNIKTTGWSSVKIQETSLHPKTAFILLLHVTFFILKYFIQFILEINNDDCTGLFQVGDRVMCLCADIMGLWTEYACVPACR